MKRGLAAVLILLVAMGAALWADADASRQARSAYASDDHAEALRLLDPGPLPLSAGALYNRGLIHHAEGRDAEALAAWRASYQLDPRSIRLIEALGLGRERAEGTAPPVAPSPAWASLLTPGELGLLTVGLWIACGLLLWRRRPQGPTRGQLLLVATAAALTATALHGRHLAQQPIAVTLNATTARDAPELEASLRHGLPALSEVRVVRRAGLFALVVDGEGQRGWVPVDGLAFPPGAH